MRTKRFTLGMIVGFASLFTIWVAKDLFPESNAQNIAAIHAAKDQDTNAKRSDSWDTSTPDFNPYDNKGLGGKGLAGGLLGGGM